MSDMKSPTGAPAPSAGLSSTPSAGPSTTTPMPDSNKIFAVLLVVSILVSALGTWTLLNKADQLPKGEIVKVIKTGPKISLFVTRAEPATLPNIQDTEASKVSMLVTKLSP